MRLTSRPTRMPVDLADHLMDVLDFLANVNIAKVAISAEPPRVYNMDLQKPSLRLHLHDPLDSRWDLGGPLTRSRIAKRLFKAWNADVLRRVESWNVNLTKSAPPEERSVLAALAANYESFDAWRDNLIIGGMRLQGPARGISLAPSTLTNGEEKGIEA
ncbi:hypothetical protein KEM55_001635 [Ascosphaera atra]|nr:hypothetical protein KEM55_001635 [Ascosphaera atra]